MRAIFYLSIFALLVSCSSKPQAEETPIDYYEGLPESFSNLLKAHGGLDTWRSFKSLEYDLQHQNDTVPSEHYTLDLTNRKDLTVADSFKIGFDGEEVWVAPNRAAYKGRSARFYHNLYSYFFTIPFIVADPGVIYKDDTVTVDGKLYNAIHVAFEEGVGDAAEDTYKILIDPTTGKMAMLLYTVTYYSGEAHENYNALSYENWTDINGVELATKLVGYKYANGAIGDKRYEVVISNAQLSTESPAQDIFMMPAKAEIDSLKTNY
ncbi:MAG: DUF6503 family protein [Cyclobacteriaceae bacterium]